MFRHLPAEQFQARLKSSKEEHYNVPEQFKKKLFWGAKLSSSVPVGEKNCPYAQSALWFTQANMVCGFCTAVALLMGWRFPGSFLLLQPHVDA